MATTVVTRGAGVRGRIEELERKVAELEAELDEVEDSFHRQQYYVLDGYIVAVRGVGDGTSIARCPTLHAAVQEATLEQALASVAEAMAVSIAGRRQSGSQIPPKDTESRCLDSHQ